MELELVNQSAKHARAIWREMDQRAYGSLRPSVSAGADKRLAATSCRSDALVRQAVFRGWSGSSSGANIIPILLGNELLSPYGHTIQTNVGVRGNRPILLRGPNF